ncbi:NEW3 domain-containing protein [Actinacidiphila guanduensis]|uniref:Alpha-galactosidase n=1 Tax=Actinacidiphila guanduensis TaxID=310781 RepID=A0A1H0NGU7_9ACTN|nr:NEW3 domain-containing protein [Actinacidiphila guanduensis]SDO91997.1 NPCBM-associated, NEW3 domain of alpha-galactosidase [Actinacidiphila guanduensis]
MRKPIRGALAAFAGALLLATGVTAAGAPAAQAADSTTTAKPVLGWSSWSFIRRTPTAQNIEAQAKALKTSGLVKDGFVYANVDDFWYHCPGSQGPDVDQYGRWVTDETAFPPKGSENGIQVVADYVHSLGLKFGLYVTPGISKQAVAQNTPIKGTTYHADDIATTTDEANYNCGGMVGIDYSKPGAQDFVNSWADQFAGWGIDYLKIDGVGTPDIGDVRAWSQALKQTGRSIHLELSNNLDINNAAAWQQLSDGWRTGGDIECYCGPNGSSYPLTTWSSLTSRFDQVAAWAPYGGPAGYNDYDSLEIGNGANDGLTLDERKTQMSLWSLAASPLILGTDLTHLDPTDLSLLKNTDVLGVDQDGIDARRITDGADSQVFAKTEKNGDAIVGLFNTASAPREVATTAKALGLPGARDYALTDLWSHGTTESAGRIAADVPPHGVALFRVHPTHQVVRGAAPSVTLGLDWAPAASDSTTRTVTATLTDNGSRPVTDAALALTGPDGATISTTSPTRARTLKPGGALQATYTIALKPSDELFAASDFQGTASYRFGPGTTHLDVGDTLTVNHAVGAPYKTYASTTASFSQSGTRLGIRAQGEDLYQPVDEYGTIYLPGAEHDGSTTTVKIDAQANTSVWAKSGIMVRNDITKAGSSAGYLALVETPGNGYLLDWDSNGDGQLDSQDSTGTATYPSWLKLVRTGTSFSGYYSTDDSTWNLVGTIDLPTAAATQDVGLTATSHAAGTTGETDFDSFTTN